MENLILKHRAFVAGQIEKSFNSDIQGSESDIEKAKYQVGQPHPNNPNILWTEWQPGKFDWKSKNGRYWKGKTGGATDNSKEQKFKQAFKDADETILQKVIDGKIQASDSEKKWAKDILDERKGAKVKDAAAKKVIDLLTASSSKYTDIKKVVAFKTDKGNWAIDYDGANTGIILNGSKLSEAELKRAGVKIEGANANSKKDSNLINDIKSNEDAFIEACGLSNIKRVVSIRETPTSVFIKYENNSGQEQEFPLTKNVANSVLKEVKAKKSKKADPRDKIAHDAGFKDYEEMRGYQNYVTSKNLLKKSSMQSKTKEDTRKKLEADVAKYEKEHADVIKRVAEKKGATSNSAAVKIDETTIDQAEYDSQLKQAKQVDDNSRSMAKNIIQGNIDKTKKKLQETISSRPGAKATIDALQKDLTKFVSQKKAVEDAEKEIAAGKADKSKDVKSLTSSVQDAYSKVYNWIKEDEENGNPHSNGGKKILDYLQNIEGNLKLLSQGKASDDDLKKLQNDVKSLSSAWDAVGYGESNLPISREDVTKLIASKQKKDGKKNTDSSGRAVYYKTLAKRFDETGKCESTDTLIGVYKNNNPSKNIEAARALRKYIMKDLNYRDNDDWTKTLNEYKKLRLNADKEGDRDAYKAYNCAYQAVKDRIAKDAKK